MSLAAELYSHPLKQDGFTNFGAGFDLNFVIFPVTVECLSDWGLSYFEILRRPMSYLDPMSIDFVRPGHYALYRPGGLAFFQLRVFLASTAVHAEALNTQRAMNILITFFILNRWVCAINVLSFPL